MLLNFLPLYYPCCWKQTSSILLVRIKTLKSVPLKGSMKGEERAASAWALTIKQIFSSEGFIFAIQSSRETSQFPEKVELNLNSLNRGSAFSESTVRPSFMKFQNSLNHLLYLSASFLDSSSSIFKTRLVSTFLNLDIS